jgi:DNA-binding MarR family transcriptional regulator
MTPRQRPAVEAVVAAIGDLVAERRRSSMAWLRDCDISLAQLHVVSTLAERGDMTVGSLAEALSISAPSASGIVDRLVERGMLMRVRSEDDRRTVRVSLAEAGRQITEQMHGVGGQQVRAILNELSDADLAELQRLAGLLRDASARVGRPNLPEAAAGH